ncbi:hypothetical protein NSS76_15395 [Bacillus sp. FSL R5-0654]|uniref:hypothetical protein n=1 Tax=Bacillus TaxID=1386 RepID=UPI001CDA3AC5|nr:MULTISPECIES: hypothetical protein [Bacillus]MEC1413763.1 hypothetical protein [Bacillus safensis]
MILKNSLPIKLPHEEIKQQSVYQVLGGHTHLSVLLEAGKQIGRTIQMWNPSI